MLCINLLCSALDVVDRQCGIIFNDMKTKYIQSHIDKIMAEGGNTTRDVIDSVISGETRRHSYQPM